MEAFLIYELKSAVILAVFYFFWRLLLRKETLHRLNRVVLLSTAALPPVLPLCIITIKKTVVLPAQAASETVSSFPLISEAWPDAIVPSATAAGSAWWVWLIFGIWVLGVVVVLANTAISAIKVSSIIRKGKYVHLADGSAVSVVEGDIAPFSWFGNIVVSRNDLEGKHREIILHEQAHIAFGHSWDVLFTDILTSFQWFNPTVWMLRNDLRELHEYQADEKVLQEGVNAREYQYLLIRKAAGDLGYSVANSFNHNNLKNRFTMMTRKQSPGAASLKALYILPLVALSLSLTAKTKTINEYQETERQVAGQAQNPFVLDIHLSVNEKGEPVIKVSGNVNTETKPKTARISADANVPMGRVDKLKEKLRGDGFLKVIYVKPSASEGTITRYMTPIQNGNRITVQKAQQYPEEYPAAIRENMCVTKINSNDRIFFKDNAYSDDARIILVGTDFIRTHGDKTLFLFTHESGTSYGEYVHLQDLLMRCYEQVRDEKAMELYGKNLSDLNGPELLKILNVYPVNIVETEVNEKAVRNP